MKLEEELVYFKGKGYNKTIILVEISMIEEEMMQNNILFLLIFASIILVINYTLSIKKRIPFLCIASFLFYFFCDKNMLILLTGIVFFSYILGMAIEKGKTSCIQKICFTFGIFMCVCTWCSFKYYNFFIESYLKLFRQINEDNIAKPISMLLPLGISYYILKVIAYLSDIYKGKIKAEENLFNYTLYISFFPQIICGPIERPQIMLEQFRKGLHFEKEVFLMGCSKIVEGIFKKTVIANRLSGYVNVIFDTPDAYPALALWMAGFFFTIQLYCDFSGYSDMAIGICNIFGVECSPNFLYPLLSKNIKEFWRRWHISLSSWLRDYIYIPLGGNKSGKWKQKINILTTFIVSGLWHGNGLTYIVWGLYNGILNLLVCQKKQKDKKLHFIKEKFIEIPINFLFVMLGFIFFRSSNINIAWKYIIKMFSSFTINMDVIINSILPFTMDYNCVSYFLIVILMIILLYIREYRLYYGYTKMCEKKIWGVLFFTFTLFLGLFGEDSFLYANF